jgi:hypothetical protein
MPSRVKLRPIQKKSRKSLPRTSSSGFTTLGRLTRESQDVEKRLQALNEKLATASADQDEVNATQFESLMHRKRQLKTLVNPALERFATEFTVIGEPILAECQAVENRERLLDRLKKTDPKKVAERKRVEAELKKIKSKKSVNRLENEIRFELRNYQKRFPVLGNLFADFNQQLRVRKPSLAELANFLIRIKVEAKMELTRVKR